MRTALHIFVGIPAMIGIYYICEWLVVGISMDFGEGFCLGLVVMAALMWLIERCDPEAFYGRRDRRLKEHSGHLD